MDSYKCYTAEDAALTKLYLWGEDIDREEISGDNYVGFELTDGDDGLTFEAYQEKLQEIREKVDADIKIADEHKNIFLNYRPQYVHEFGKYQAYLSK